tara:strand:+ start:278 stop:1006 length:729 start_codon:yes stop_codon:yes gene_type:complete
MRILRGDLDVHPRGPKIDGKKKAIIIGATGATGKKLLRQLLDSSYWDGVTTVARRPVLGGEGHDKLYEVTIDSFKDLSSTKDDWNGHDVFFNCIGTTRGKAGSAKAFVDIEYGISLKAAELASSAGIQNATVISAGGANAEQWAPEWIHPLLYTKTIGQKEQTITKHFPFRNVTIFRPGMLIRKYNNESALQRFFNTTNLGLPVDLLASAMIRDAESLSLGQEITEPFVYSGNSCIKSSIDL